MLLRAVELTKEFSGRTVLDSASLAIAPGEKSALIGPNGCGKTTLIRMLTGELEPDGGTLWIRKGLSVGCLSQHAEAMEGLTVLDVVRAGRAHVSEVAERLTALEARMEHGLVPSEDAEEYGFLHMLYAERDGYALDRDAVNVLKRLGFEEADFNRSAEELSGGQQTRLRLAKLLLQEPEMLILDEPSNHLDIQAIEWLERWIRRYPGAVMLITHDRRMLQTCCDRFYEIRAGKTYAFPGPFEKYREERRLLVIREQAEATRADAEIAKLDEFVRRFINSQRTAQARGRQKMLNRILEARPTEIKEAVTRVQKIAPKKRSGDVVAEFESASLGFDGVCVVSGLNWTLRRGERWGVVGPNGSGKSTIVRSMVGELAPITGNVRIGAGVEIGYFGQDAGFAASEESAMDLLVGKYGIAAQQARDLLGRFSISGDAVFQPLRTRSGGERAKVAFCCLVLDAPNLLVLDEPTNHLDLTSCEALADSLAAYEGTLVMVSHDRHLLATVTNHTLFVEPGRVDQQEGSIADRTVGEAHIPKPQGKNNVASSRSPQIAKPILTPREVSKQISVSRRRVAEVEADIESVEANIADIERHLSGAPTPQRAMDLSSDHAALQQRLSELMASWEAECVALQHLEAAQG